MNRHDFELREQGWNEFHAWERGRSVAELPLDATLRRVNGARALALAADPPPLLRIDETVTRVRLMHEAFASIKPAT